MIDGEKRGRVGHRSSESGVLESGADPQPGDRIAGKYEIRRMIAQGGVGLVYLATVIDPKDGGATEVVIKLLAKRWLADADAVARFEREAKRLRSLEHPNIVSMLDYGVDHGRPYLVMEYIEGESLSDYLSARGRLSLREFVPIAAQVLKGMGHAHSRKMMIRDVKPSNIMLCQRKGRANFVKILDFGLAKFLEEESPLTEGYVLGTAGYLAPEALRGGQLDLRVDVYSIGVLFYHLLSGEMPFEADSTEAIFFKTLNEKPTDLRERLGRGHDVPEGLVKLIDSCLEKDPEQRPEDANLVVEALIDVVPAALFRLPLIGARGPNGAPLGVGNTGLIQLVGNNPSIQRPFPVVSEPPPNRRMRVIAWGAAYGLTCLVAGLALYATVYRSGSQPGSPLESAEVSETSPSSVVAIPEVAPQRAEPPGAEAVEPAAEPTAPSEVAPAGEPEHAVVFLASFPEASVIIDGEDRGVTPFKHPLTVGKHDVLMRAPGYREWIQTIEVTDGDFEPISVYLERIRTTGRRAGGRGTSQPLQGLPSVDAVASSVVAPASTPPAAPSTEGRAEEPRDERPSVFLQAQPPKARPQRSLLAPQ